MYYKTVAAFVLYIVFVC